MCASQISATPAQLNEASSAGATATSSQKPDGTPLTNAFNPKGSQKNSASRATTATIAPILPAPTPTSMAAPLPVPQPAPVLPDPAPQTSFAVTSVSVNLAASLEPSSPNPSNPLPSSNFFSPGSLPGPVEDPLSAAAFGTTCSGSEPSSASQEATPEMAAAAALAPTFSQATSEQVVNTTISDNQIVSRTFSIASAGSSGQTAIPLSSAPRLSSLPEAGNQPGDPGLSAQNSSAQPENIDPSAATSALYSDVPSGTVANNIPTGSSAVLSTDAAAGFASVVQGLANTGSKDPTATTDQASAAQSSGMQTMQSATTKISSGVSVTVVASKNIQPNQVPDSAPEDIPQLNVKPSPARQPSAPALSVAEKAKSTTTSTSSIQPPADHASSGSAVELRQPLSAFAMQTAASSSTNSSPNLPPPSSSASTAAPNGNSQPATNIPAGNGAISAAGTGTPIASSGAAQTVTPASAADTNSEQNLSGDGSANPSQKKGLAVSSVPTISLPATSFHSATTALADPTIQGANVQLATSGSAPKSDGSVPLGPADSSRASSPEFPTGAGPVQVAQMANKAAQAEMRIGMNTSAFGNVEVRTVVHSNEVGVAIGSERGDLRSLLSSELPGIAHALQQQSLRLNEVDFHQGGFAFSNQMSSGSDSQQRFASRAVPTFLPEVSSNETPEAAEPLSTARGSGLSILA